MSAPSTTPLLRVENLTKHFPITAGFFVKREVGRVRAVDDVSFHIDQGETLGLVGESPTVSSSLRARLVISGPGFAPCT